MKRSISITVLTTLLSALLAIAPLDALALDGAKTTDDAAGDEQMMDVDPADDPNTTGDAASGAQSGNAESDMQVIEEDEGGSDAPEGQPAQPATQDAEGQMEVQDPEDSQDPQADAQDTDNPEGGMEVLDDQDAPEGEGSQDADGQQDQEQSDDDSSKTPDDSDDKTDDQSEQGAATTDVSTEEGETSGTEQPSLQAEASTHTAGAVTVKAYVQGSGWKDGKKGSDGIIWVGSSSKGLRIEALKLSLGGTKGGITYRAHVQSIGWQDWKSDGAEAGSANGKRRVEALRIKLTGDAKDAYDLYYRVCVQDQGWMGWAKNGALSGTTGYAQRIESVQVKLVAKGGSAPSGYGKAYKDHGFSAKGHQQNYGWLDESTGYRFTIGKPGSGMRLEALAIDRPTSDVSGSVVYSAHVQGSGWQTRRVNGAIAGTTGEGLRVEGVRIRLTGSLKKSYNAWYRVYVRGVGWMAWTKNGKDAGTEGFGLSVDAVQVEFLSKNASKPSKKGQALSSAYAADSSISLWYKANVDGAWQGYVTDGATSGTTGTSKPIKAVSARLTGIPGTVSYKLHVTSKGWINSQSNGTRAGDGVNTVQAIRVSLKGDVQKFYDVWYRAYVQRGGWLGWTKNGKTAGSTGMDLRLEAVQMRLVPKGGSAPGDTNHPTYNYVVKNGKAGWQNPARYPQVSSYSVQLPSYCTGYHTYVTPSRISVWATREECIEAFIGRAYDYLGTTYREPWSQAPGIGVDCSGLVLQCLYATGMDLEHAAGTEKVGGFNPYNHFHVPAQTYNSMRWYENNTFMPVSLSNIRRGDLIFYSGHVAIYLGGGQIIHSTSAFGGSVMVSSLYVWSPIGAQRPFV